MNPVQQLLTDHIGLWTGADTAKKSGRGRASGNAGTIYGIKKLRELILELAVRGKLVPQDASDEPASELLKRIQIEKNKLVDEGKIKKQKTLMEITDAESTIKLPHGWVRTRLADIVNILNGRAYKKEELLEAGTPVLRVGNLFTSDHWYYSDLILGEDKYCNKDDLLFAWSASFGPFIWNGEKSIYHYHIWKLDLYGGDLIYKRYLYTFLLEQTQKIKSAGHGVMMIHMTKEKMEKLVVYLPPVSEQHRIVAKVDELMALCDQLETGHTDAADAHEKIVNHLLVTLTASQDSADFNAAWQRIAAHFDMLFVTEASINALKQALLQLAVMGKLVPQDPDGEPASELLGRIKEEKARLVFEGKIKKDKPLTAITDDEKPFKLPRGWEWVRLGVALEITGGVTLGRKLNDTELIELPYLRVANVQRGYLDLDGIKMVEIRRSELARYQLIDDDLLVTEGGDWDKVGRTAIWNSEIEVCVHQNHIFRMRIQINQLSSSWIEMYMNSIAKAYFQNASKKTTNLASINMTQLKNCLLAVPALEEQHRIVAKVDELMSLCDRMKARIADVGSLQRKLADVMVAQAVA
ncbi:restriction endonuclease subunit S [Janthinobacterium tructae]|uniref:restriction endonuclease subunit S n=1 Tax=Janthinobacterium tructae TaxID=2590869 RepID=UPI00249A0A53|nr:restriction endonuclease subunit S [Janthinobacterium tructae]MDI3294523.1 restriction endonuclease subunit S [Janthinobacterium tructae]